jgi:hypothetical protein
MHILNNINFLCCFLAIRNCLLHVHTKKTQVELTHVNRKFPYHITNIYFQTIEILIHFILSSIGIHIQKEKLSYQIYISSIVSNNVNLDKKLKSNLGYRKLVCI